jgi:uncharacterized membrane protein
VGKETRGEVVVYLLLDRGKKQKMAIAVIVTIVVLVIGYVDAVCYYFAKWPERASSPWYKLIGGGIVALIRFGIDK